MDDDANSTPNDASDPGHGPLILGVTWMLTSFCIVCIVGRFYVRIFIACALSLDDWFMFAAVILQVVFQACVTTACKWGLGKHDDDISYDPQLIKILMWSWIATTPGILVSILARISAAILLIRIFGSKAVLKWFLIAFTAAQAIVAAALIIISWVQASPVEGIWDPRLPAARWDPRIQQYVGYLMRSMFCFSDVTYVLVPISIIWALNMPLYRKVGLCIVMTLMLITVAASILKIITSQPEPNNMPDVQYKDSIAVLWFAIEQSLVIIMGCLPPLTSISKSPTVRQYITRPLVGMVWPERTSRKRGAVRSSADGGGSKRHGSASSAGGCFGKKKRFDHSTYYGRSAYYDLELSTHKLGRLGRRDVLPPEEGEEELRGPVITHEMPRSSRSLDSEEVKNIRRTDQFTITYCSQEQAAREAENV